MNTKEQGRRAPRRDRRPVNRKPEPEVNYTEAKPFNKYKLLLRLAIVVAVVLALVFGMSIFFKVRTVEVAGVEKYTENDVWQASGIQEGESLLSLNFAKISAKIMTELPYIDSVRIGINLPGTVAIQITELPVVYAIEATDNSWWLISAKGKAVEKITASDAVGYTRLLGVQLETPNIGETVVAAEPEPEIVDGVTVPVTVYARERLEALLTIAQSLEKSGVLGDAASVDVSDMGEITLWYGQQYEVNLGEAVNLSYKIEAMKQAIDQMSAYQTGRLDASFTVYPDQVGYKPFS